MKPPTISCPRISFCRAISLGLLFIGIAGCAEFGGIGYPNSGGGYGGGGYPYGYPGYAYPGYGYRDPYRNPYYLNKPPTIWTPKAQARKDLNTIYDHRDQIAKLPPKQREQVLRYAEELGKKAWGSKKRHYQAM